MVSLLSINNAAALTLLKGGPQNSVSSFMNSPVFKVQTSEVFNSISAAFSSGDMQKQYQEASKFFSDRGTLSGHSGAKRVFAGRDCQFHNYAYAIFSKLLK